MGIVPVPQYNFRDPFSARTRYPVYRMEKILMEYLEVIFDKYEVSDQRIIFA